MIDLSEILNKSYVYTKNHKFLWFFGFFLTGFGTMNFIRHVDFNAASLLHRWESFKVALHLSPGLLIIAIIGTLLIMFGMTFLGAVARSVIIYSGLHLERKELVTMNLSLKGTRKSFWRVFWVGLFTGLTMFFILSWLAIPLYFVFQNGTEFRAVLLTLIAIAIFVPVIIVLSLVNIFSACYIVVYDFKILPALKGSFDLLATAWEKTVSLFSILIIIYAFFFFLSATVLGLFGFVAYGLTQLLHSLSANEISGILLVIISLLSFLLIFVNAILNVFTNFAWTLFFLKIVKAKLIKESEVVPVVGG
jgi:hypothetical protein